MFEESRVGQKDIPPHLKTMTGEDYQPARLYYRVGQKNAVLGRFKRLRCIDYDSSQNRWAWLYQEEAKDIKFDRSYRDIPKHDRPVVLGYFSLEGEQTLRLDVDSFERVIEAIVFFDSKINRRLANVTTVKVVNKLFPEAIAEEERFNHHTHFFEQLQAANFEREMEKVEELTAQCETDEEKEEVALAYLEKRMKKTLPEVEELGVHFYEDGIENMDMSLRMRHVEAIEHWKGNKNFTQHDVMNTILERLDDEDF